MSWLAIVTFLLVFCGLTKSQNTNLVLNSSFEEHNRCPNNDDEGIVYYDDVPYWNDTLFYGTPDYYNVCAIPLPSYPWLQYPNFGIPRNGLGYQHARTGDAYVGIITLNVGTDVREYLITRLLSPLSQRKKYIISFYASLADKVSCATSKLGMLLVDTLPQYSSNNNLFGNPVQIINTQAELILKQEWQLVQDTFVSNGGEEFAIIGNFFELNDSDTHSFNSDSLLSGSYYFIDDVSVVELDTTTGIDENEFSHFQIYPNPATNTISIRNRIPISVSIFSLSGSLLLFQMIKKEEIIDISHLPNGIYFVTVGNKREKLVVCR